MPLRDKQGIAELAGANSACAPAFDATDAWHRLLHAQIIIRCANR